MPADDDAPHLPDVRLRCAASCRPGGSWSSVDWRGCAPPFWGGQAAAPAPRPAHQLLGSRPRLTTSGTPFQRSAILLHTRTVHRLRKGRTGISSFSQSCLDVFSLTPARLLLHPGSRKTRRTNSSSPSRLPFRLNNSVNPKQQQSPRRNSDNPNSRLLIACFANHGCAPTLAHHDGHFTRRAATRAARSSAGSGSILQDIRPRCLGRVVSRPPPRLILAPNHPRNVATTSPVRRGIRVGVGLGLAAK
jgi:hypothetical protein